MSDDLAPAQMPPVPVDWKDLQHLFDLCTSSMDFGSGFLESDDVDLLRRLAKTLGVDPMKATPSGFADQYPHQYDGWMTTVWGPKRTRAERCRVCNHEAGHLSHADPTADTVDWGATS